MRKSECPLCRTALTPPIGTDSPITIPIMQQFIPNIQRREIVERSRVARQAVADQIRLRELQRQQEQNEQLMQLQQEMQQQMQQQTLMQQ